MCETRPFVCPAAPHFTVMRTNYETTFYKLHSTNYVHKKTHIIKYLFNI